MSEVRVRFAPSPTGALHIGGVRTALYNYLFARKHGGKMLLRIEDTDQTRYVPGAEEYIREALEWVGITLDESPWQGGPHAPYRQSERKAMYAQYAMGLIEKGFAYYAFDTEEDLDAMRERLKAANVPNPQYNTITRATMRNSTTLPDDEVKQLLASGTPYVVRLKVPRKEEVRLNDMIRGWVVVHSSSLDDKVLLKSDGMPTYHLANVVDDHLMGITHVIRGEEWLPSAPIHVLLYKYLGWEDTMPRMAHLPLLLKPDGNGKLSKRDADMGGFPVFPLEWNPPTGEKAMGFREQGYLSDAMVNFLAFLGWNPGTQQEIFSMDELIEAFSIERIGKAGAKFDIHKAQWFNQQYLRELPAATLAASLKKEMAAQGYTVDEAKAEKIAVLVKDRCTFAADLAREAMLFVAMPEAYDPAAVQTKWNAESAAVVAEMKSVLEGVSDFSATGVHDALFALLNAKGLKPGKVMPALRLSLTGAGQGADLMSIIELLGKEETLKRITFSLSRLAVPQ